MMPSVKATAPVIIVVALAWLFATAWSAEFQTADPLKAFVYQEYPLGSDYFIHGRASTLLLRCVLSKQEHGLEGVAFSERSIWGNRGGDWEVFRREDTGNFVYVGTRRIDSSACLESCQSSEFFATDRCTWRRGWQP